MRAEHIMNISWSQSQSRKLVYDRKEIQFEASIRGERAIQRCPRIDQDVSAIACLNQIASQQW